MGIIASYTVGQDDQNKSNRAYSMTTLSEND